MTDCKEIGERLLDWVEGELSGAEQARIAAHLASCASCKEEVQVLQAMMKGLSQLPELAPPRGVESAVMARLRARKAAFPGAKAPSSFLAWLGSRPALAAAGALAVVLLLVGGFALVGRSPQGGAMQVAAVPSGVKLEVSAGTATADNAAASHGVALVEGALLRVSDDFKGKLVYPDGSWVRVRPGASVRVFSRSLGLQEGAVWLKVQKGGEGFQVETPQAVVAVRGTVFGVGHDPASSSTSVTVEDGSVEVSTAKDRVLLAAGQSATAGADLKISPTESFPAIFKMERENFVGQHYRHGVAIPNPEPAPKRLPEDFPAPGN